MDVTVIWISGFYDGPLSGICLSHSRLFWFAIDDDCDISADDRKYLVYEMTDEELREQVTQEVLFQQHISYEYKELDVSNRIPVGKFIN